MASPSSPDHAASGAPAPPERRSVPRLPVDLEIDCGHQDTFLFAYITDLSALGIFVRANNPHPPGTRLALRFALPDDAGPATAEGEVAWTSPYQPEAPGGLHAGMGIRFVALDPALRQRLLRVMQLSTPPLPPATAPR